MTDAELRWTVWTVGSVVQAQDCGLSRVSILGVKVDDVPLRRKQEDATSLRMFETGPTPAIPLTKASDMSEPRLD